MSGGWRGAPILIPPIDLDISFDQRWRQFVSAGIDLDGLIKFFLCIAWVRCVIHVTIFLVLMIEGTNSLVIRMKPNAMRRRVVHITGGSSKDILPGSTDPECQR